MARIKCGKCTTTHQSVAAVRACHDGAEIGTCIWLVERTHAWFDDETGDGDSWEAIEDCGAECIYTQTGWSCAVGHSYVDMETRHREGWDYVESREEAENMMRHSNVEPRDLVTGGAFAW
jgi:hypothetical protein